MYIYIYKINLRTAAVSLFESSSAQFTSDVYILYHRLHLLVSKLPVKSRLLQIEAYTQDDVQHPAMSKKQHCQHILYLDVTARSCTTKQNAQNYYHI